MWKKNLAQILIACALTLSTSQSGYCDSTRVNSSPSFPARKLKLQFNSLADGLYDGDPNSGTLTTTSATGLVPNDGMISVELTSGFTPPIAATCWYWSTDASKWVHIGSTAADYTKTFDATYTQAQFAAPIGSAYIITVNAHLTTAVYVSGRAYKDNANSQPGYDQ